jgi:signal transduction histidine kinase
VLDNLLANAIKYSPDGGDIALTLSQEDDESGSWALLTVTDQGVGISARDLPHVFERFYRGKDTTTWITGTGIGLASVRQIVEQHGGSVRVESQVGKGSAFMVCLPLVDLSTESLSTGTYDGS